MRDCQSVRRPRQGDQAARGATKRCIPQRWITDRTRRVKVRVWSWEAESAFMEATQILSAPHWTVSSSDNIMLQIELGNRATVRRV